MSNITFLLNRLGEKLAGGIPARDNIEAYAHLSMRGNGAGLDLDVERPDVSRLKLHLTEWRGDKSEFERETLAAILIDDVNMKLLVGRPEQVELIHDSLVDMSEDE